MLIDWFTVVAQIINFVILMWLLKHFLYQPVLNAIDTREKCITEQIALATKTQSTAMAQRLEFEAKNKDFEQQHAERLEKSNAEAQASRQQLIIDARNEVEKLRTQWQQALVKEQHELSQSITTNVQRGVLDIAGKTLIELADYSLEERMVAKFITQLQTLDEAQKIQLSTQSESGVKAIIIRSAFELSQAARISLCEVVQATLSSSNVTFEVEQELIVGIELISSGHKIAWNVADYLSAFEASITNFLDNKKVDTKITKDV
jgi:F-type H+-transporting ATPase subunit b